MLPCAPVWRGFISCRVRAACLIDYKYTKIINKSKILIKIFVIMTVIRYREALLGRVVMRHASVRTIEAGLCQNKGS